MNIDSEAGAQLRRAVTELVGTAQSNLPPAEKLELLCTQIGTVAFWAERAGLEAPAPPGSGPHWGRQSEVRRTS